MTLALARSRGMTVLAWHQNEQFGLRQIDVEGSTVRREQMGQSCNTSPSGLATESLVVVVVVGR